MKSMSDQHLTNSKADRRNGTIDIIRLLAAFAIVWFHTGAEGARIAYAGLPLFVVIMAMFAGRVHNKSWKSIAVARWRRIMRPWLVWSAIYTPLIVLDHYLIGAVEDSEPLFRPWMLLVGPTVHLWFLPFAFVVTLLIGMMAVKIQSKSSTLVSGISLALFSASLYVTDTILNSTAVIPVAQWSFVTPAIFFGLALSAVSNSSLKVRLGFACAGLTILVSAELVGLERVAFPYAIGCIAAVVASYAVTRATSFSNTMVPVSLLIYLVHPLVIAAIRFVFQEQVDPVLIAVLACAGSFIFAMAVVKLRLDWLY